MVRLLRSTGLIVEEQGIAPHIPVFDRSQRSDGTLSRENFRFDDAANVYICPAGKALTTTGALVNDETTLLYRGSTSDCSPCEHKNRCCPNTPARKIPRSIYERARDVARALAGTPEFEQGGNANASKCYLRILSGFCGSDDCGCEDQAALATNSCLQRPPKI